MQAIIDPARAKRFGFALILLAVIGFFFWTQSRYPDLDDKLLMAGAIQLEDPLGFEALIPITSEQSVGERIVYSTINWVKTNRKGMTFGILFGAAFLTVLGYLRRRNFQNGWANSFLGMVIGAPLGVCVNCAAPIARGMYAGGARAETTLSAMVASPTLNVVVLTMTLSLMPLYLFFTKIALSLIVILIAVPIIARFMKPEELQRAVPETETFRAPEPDPAEIEGLAHAALRFGEDFARNLWFILRVTVPLMLLAGFMGALFATLVPPEFIQNREFGVLGLIFAAIVGTIAPAPIGFDVVFSAALLNGGMTPGYVMTMLFSLGSFSIYSFFIVANSISWRAAWLLAGTVMALSAIAGFGVHTFNSWQTERALQMLSDPAPAAAAEAGERPELSARGDGPGAAPAAAGQGAEGTRIEIEARPFNERSPAADTAFTRQEAWRLGIDQPVEFSFADMWPPFWEGRSISSGDIDGDGDLDLAIASTEAGVRLYLNDGAGGFSLSEQSVAPFEDLPVFNAPLVDIDNDGALDLVLASFREGEYWIRNVGGRFDFENFNRIENRDDVILALSMSFADADRDGDLDMALGHWAAGWYRRVPGEESRNRIIFNDDGALSGQDYLDLPGIPGETLSLLFSDIDLDGAADLLVGNDFEIPDMFYYGDGEGGFDLVTRADGVFPMTTTTTMALKSADLDNDLRPDIYAAQIAGRAASASERLNMQPIGRYCDGIEREEDAARCELNMEIKAWYRSGNRLDAGQAWRCNELEGRYQAECRAMMIKDLAIQTDNPATCGLIPVGQVRARQLCEVHFQPIRPLAQAEIEENIPQIGARNVLFTPTGARAYAETARQAGLEVGGWSWDVKIGDVDNDGFQDMYIVNGTWVPNEVTPSNLFFRNDGAGRFSEETEAAGLVDYAMTAAAAQLDLDFDGDLDFITMPVNSPVAAFINNSQSGQSIAFQLRDEAGNHFGIGARIEIAHGDGRVQMREIQSGGGFMSFDAPVAHFGLGEDERVETVRIHWPAGGVTVLDDGFDAGALYTIHRRMADMTETAE